MTVTGIEKIKEYLGEYKSNYVIIGGTATNLNLDDEELVGRMTHDIDMIVVCEAITPEYVRSFWNLIRAGGYKPCVVNTEIGFKRTFYRFVEPTDVTFPSYIELFCRLPDSIQVPEDMHLVHISTEDYLSSFSAIMMDNDYYNYAISHTTEIQGIQVLDKTALIVLKAKAYISNLERKNAGQRVHQDDIDKHKKDIYRISFLIDEEHEKADVSEAIKKDMRKFIETIKDKPINTKAIANYMGVQEITMLQFINKLHTVFSL